MDWPILTWRVALVLATVLAAAGMIYPLIMGVRDYERRRRDDVQARVDASMARWSYLADRRS